MFYNVHICWNIAYGKTIDNMKIYYIVGIQFILTLNSVVKRTFCVKLQLLGHNNQKLFLQVQVGQHGVSSNTEGQNNARTR